MEEYEIVWRGPFTFEEILEIEGEVFDEEIYAVAWLPQKRKHKTLYIGIAFNQYIRQRLKGPHDADYRIWQKRGETSIRYFLGSLQLKENQRRSRSRILRIEQAIICYHYNCEGMCEDNIQNTKSIDDYDFKIKNKGSVPPGIVDFYIDGDDWGRL